MIMPRRDVDVAKYRNPLRVIIFMMAAFLVSCDRESFDSADDLKSYVMEPANNLIRKSSFEDYEVSVAYKPADLLIYQEIGGEPTDHQKLFNIEKKYRDNYYFVVRVAKRSSVNSDIDHARFRDLSSSLSRFVSITTSDNDTIHEDEFSIEETNLFNSATETIFVVSKDKARSQDWIKFNLNEFGLGLGDHEFKFHIHDLEAVPKLKFELIS